MLPFLLLAACTPQNAQLVSGSYVALLSEGTSLSLSNGDVVPETYGTNYTIDCRDAGDFFTNVEEETFIRRGVFACQPDEERRLEGSIECGDIAVRDDYPVAVPAEFNWCSRPDDADGTDFADWPLQHETWANQAGFRVVAEELAPWRGEATITGEGDLQIGFHHALPSGADMRFIFAVDPDFQPLVCTTNDAGQVESPKFDGDWVANWSTELERIQDLPAPQRAAYEHMEPYLDGGRLFFLNARSLQINPQVTDAGRIDGWSLPEQYVAGATTGKYAEEELTLRTSIFARPSVSDAFDPDDEENPPPFVGGDLWWCELPDGAAPDSEACIGDSRFENMAALRDEVETVATETFQDFRTLFRPVAGDDPIFAYRPIGHTNEWRPRDTIPTGFDSWGELHYSYVVFSEDSDLTVGGSAEGAFTLVLQARESFTRVVIKGQFEIDSISRDIWATQDLRSENDLEPCFQP